MFVPSLDATFAEGLPTVVAIFPMRLIVEKLEAIGGDGKWLERDWRIRVRLNWHHKARSAVRHMLDGTRRIDAAEAKQIELAHVKYCAEQIEANRVENAKLFASMRSAIAAMEASDPEFYGPHIEALGADMLRRGNLVSKNRGET